VGRDDLTVHGFRDWAAERTNFPSEVAEMALAHTVSKVEQAYPRGGHVRAAPALDGGLGDILCHPEGSDTVERRADEAARPKIEATGLA
jgi:hypothetical protein